MGSPNNQKQQEIRSPKLKNKKTLCRNILLYGHCKFSDKTCQFRHDISSPANSPSLSATKKKLNAASASFQPNKSLSIQNANAPVFVPRSRESSSMSLHSMGSVSSKNIPNAPSGSYMTSSLLVNSQYPDDLSLFYNQQSHFQPTNYHLYNPPLQHPPILQPYERLTNDLFIDSKLRESIQKKCEASHQVAAALPTDVAIYKSLVPLNTKLDRFKHNLGYPCWTYKAISTLDNLTYTLQRVQNCNVQCSKVLLEKWRSLLHPNVISIHDVFSTNTFNDSSLMFVYDYYPCSRSLHQLYFSTQNSGGKTSIDDLNEKTLWFFMCQTASALHYLHNHGLSPSGISLSRVLVDSNNRIRLSSCATKSLLQSDTLSIEESKNDDIKSFGKMMVALCTGNVDEDLTTAATNIRKNYSHDFWKAIIFLISETHENKDMTNFMNLIAPQLMQIVNNSFAKTQKTEACLSGLMEHNRIVRILFKLIHVLENPNAAVNPRSLTKEKRVQLSQLFRDFVFHQVDESGSPVLDLQHVLTCLSKLVAGSNKRIVLVSRDEREFTPISYDELKTCIESAFQAQLHS
ncbi:serine/threonine protein kinase [Schizosaccharomyces japonicus yFS275]|uniref:PAN2-PAN3 deadenylation complex subunit PAN3 n=1 Tax=Schizosaccharomyces japonicus (strain yFS275 / FY16936) TaxID=402676 RepID=B6K186_SCHJY|nr:serine/threonine protein kinase [Schizosaccharomyces japonicus yFS275]EEB07707.1 serine/threonine protein kinase [Schizosaccharomyces japonicus yFS275]